MSWRGEIRLGIEGVLTVSLERVSGVKVGAAGRVEAAFVVRARQQEGNRFAIAAARLFGATFGDGRSE